MKKKTAALAAALALSACCVLTALPACNDGNEQQNYRREYYSMSTSADLLVSAKNFSREKFDGLAQSVQTFLTATEKSLSLGNKNSCVYRFNRAAAGERVEIDQTAYTVLSEALAVYGLTDGYYNPGVWHSANAYRFAVCTAEDSDEFPYRQGVFSLPEEKYVTAFQTLSQSFAQVELSQSDGKYYATKPLSTVKVEGDETEYNLRIDLGGIGKGWCVDKIYEMMQEAGAEYGYFNFGMSSIGIAKYAGNSSGGYTVSARDPRGNSGAQYMSVTAQNITLSTSGDSEQYYEVDGVRYCHIIDPTTGAPIRTGVASVTVLGEDGARCDAYTTALASMGKERAVQFINANLTDCKVIMLIIDGGKGEIITNCPEEVTVRNKNYKICNQVLDGKIVLN